MWGFVFQNGYSWIQVNNLSQRLLAKLLKKKSVLKHLLFLIFKPCDFNLPNYIKMNCPIINLNYQHFRPYVHVPVLVISRLHLTRRHDTAPKYYQYYSPTSMGLQVTGGEAKHANTSRMEWNRVSRGLHMDWPRHWPHIYTLPTWVNADDTWL